MNWPTAFATAIGSICAALIVITFIMKGGDE